MKKILLLGDSIRMGYQESVKKELGSSFDCRFSAENGRFAKFTLNELDRIFEECCKDGNPDLIHWNNGLWDSAIVCREDGIFTDPDEYEKYMRLLIRELRKRSGKVVFATTTPVRSGSLNQKLEYIRCLNARILPVMKSENIPVNDLYSFVEPEMETLIGPDCIHLTESGRAKVGKEVADFIRAQFI